MPPVPPSQRLGLRAALVRQRLPVNPLVVLVPDVRSYAAAIERWRYDDGVCHPVLIDDGSWASRRAIARFVRAFKPESVVRWEAPGEFAWPADPRAVESLLTRIAARPWLREAGDEDALRARWSELKFVPPGIVVAHAEDPAWPAALALAARRGQPILWLQGPPAIGGGPNGYLSATDACALARRISDFAEASGYSWSALGDEIEAVTLCLNGATKVFLGDKDQRAMLALTDWLGRTPGAADEPPEKGPQVARWAWAGQIIGNAWQSAYAAMCSLFLTTDSAWLFDGYDPAPPWNRFDATEAATSLEKAGIASIVDDDNGRSIVSWRRRTARGIDAGLVCVNSSGNQDFFDLKPGQGRPGDVPVLRRPAMVHFVHSWSAAAPGDPDTVAGRWLERGAYAYVGSVHEPYLQAFVPTPKLTLRLVAGLPWGAAARLDAGEVWKVSILGDPLITLGKPGPVVKGRGTPEGARHLEDELAEAVKARAYATALTTLLLLGREEDAAGLVEAVLREDRENFTADAAAAGLPAVFFAGEPGLVAETYRLAQARLGEESASRATAMREARDMLWHALYPGLGSLSRPQAELLADNLRPQTLVRDAGEAFTALTAAAGKAAAEAALRAAAAKISDPNLRRQVEQVGR